jgi:ABC-2 type transport system permease protein
MGVMLRLSFRQMAGRRRFALLFVLAALPVGLAIILNVFVSDDSEFDREFINTLIDGMIIAAIMPLVVMALATSAFGNEIEDNTLNVLVLKPISRASIVIPKLIGSIAYTAPLVVGSGVAVTPIALGDGGGRAAVATGVALLVGAVTYAAVFTWAGLISTKALGIAVVYVFLWEGLMTSFLGGVRYLSIRGYTLGILYGLDETTFASIEDRVIGFPAAIVGAGLVTVGFTVLTVLRLKRMDVQ